MMDPDFKQLFMSMNDALPANYCSSHIYRLIGSLEERSSPHRQEGVHRSPAGRDDQGHVPPHSDRHVAAGSEGEARGHDEEQHDHQIRGERRRRVAVPDSDVDRNRWGAP